MRHHLGRGDAQRGGQRVPGALVQEGLRHPHIQVTPGRGQALGIDGKEIYPPTGYSALPEVLPVLVISRSIFGGYLDEEYLDSVSILIEWGSLFNEK